MPKSALPDGRADIKPLEIRALIARFMHIAMQGDREFRSETPRAWNSRISFWISREPLFIPFGTYQWLSPFGPTFLAEGALWSQSSATPPLEREGDAYKLVRTRARPDADVKALLPPQETIQSTVTSRYGYVGHTYAQTSPASWDYTHFGVSLRAPRDLMA